MISDVLNDLYVYLPAFLANAAPVVAKNIPGLRGLDRSIYATYMGKNKTWRGFLSGLIVAACFAAAQYGMAGIIPASLPYASLLSALQLGLLLGAGALVGDMTESAIKRLIGIPPGNALPYLDGVDYILGAMLFLLPWYTPSLWGVIVLLIIAPLASLLANMTAFAMGWKKQW